MRKTEKETGKEDNNPSPERIKLTPLPGKGFQFSEDDHE
jgi:hypothetical protein